MLMMMIFATFTSSWTSCRNFPWKEVGHGLSRDFVLRLFYFLACILTSVTMNLFSNTYSDKAITLICRDISAEKSKMFFSHWNKINTRDYDTKSSRPALKSFCFCFSAIVITPTHKFAFARSCKSYSAICNNQ